MTRVWFILAAVAALIATALGATAASAHQSAATSQIRLGGLGFSSLGSGSLEGTTPGVESVILLNYAYTTKSLKGYSIKDAAGNVVPLCAWPVTGLLDCTSTTADHDADGVTNVNDADTWLSVGARSQLLVNVEGRNDGPLLNNGGDTVYLRNSVGAVLSYVKYAAVNPTS